MSESSEKKSLAPHFVIVGIVLIVILAVVFWPSDDKPEVVEAPEPEVVEPQAPPAIEPEVFETQPVAPTVELEEKEVVEPLPEVVEEKPEPLDVSDPAIKSSLLENSTADESSVNRMLVNEGLLQRFVVSVTNLANDEMAPNHQLLTPPEQNFRVYSQAGKQWIDAASYKRYTPYVNMLESFDNEGLLNVYAMYKDDIQAKYAEIGDPDKDFNTVLLDAIDQLLDTPEVPVPVEVYTDSVAYKYADERLENLNEPQKQLLRTGPDNMRRIKAKLRELKVLVEERGSN
ncbi:DUF3014 domain-containing protein [Alteromonas gracilis]|uniref:DUF3014 domain-containing protein n=1 Tax=Alteromonas gracilis TaxID=1479524 RepID=UPI0030CCA3BB